MRVTWAPLAEAQVAEAFAYIAAERPAAALKWFERIVARTESLSALPDQGRMVPEGERESVREVLVAPYRVVYHRDEEAVVVLTVQHERRDLDLEGVPLRWVEPAHRAERGEME
ncbi:MAG: type II toxin-antitoxin system RelE/ParE family toxin [Actinomycetota bacterium]|nr:type II toxin-antitoxin system RelE/ParE family toxin [Actinomycetota bacterium]